MEQVLTLEEITKAVYAFSGLVLGKEDFPKWEDLSEAEQNAHYINIHKYISDQPVEHPSEVPYLLPNGFKDKTFHMSVQLHSKF